MSSVEPINRIISVATKIGGVLTLPVLLIGVLYWVFSPGSFDKVWDKFNQLSGEQTFILLLAGLVLFVISILGLALLWFILEQKKLMGGYNTPSKDSITVVNASKVERDLILGDNVKGDKNVKNIK